MSPFAKKPRLLCVVDCVSLIHRIVIVMINTLNLSKLRHYNVHGRDIEWDNVSLGTRVRRGRTWRPTWRDDIDTTSDQVPRPRVSGIVVGYVDSDDVLVGRNTNAIYDTDRLGANRGWVAVRWDTGKESVYPIGAYGVFSLVAA